MGSIRWAASMIPPQRPVPVPTAVAGGGGIGNRFAGATGSVQLAYQREQWGLAAIWSRVQPDTQYVPSTTPLTHGAIDHNIEAKTNAFGLSGFWQPLHISQFGGLIKTSFRF